MGTRGVRGRGAFYYLRRPMVAPDGPRPHEPVPPPLLSSPGGTVMRAAPLLVLALVAPVGCNREAAPATGANPAGGPTVVKVVRPAKKPVRWAIEQPASVQPLE